MAIVTQGNLFAALWRVPQAWVAALSLTLAAGTHSRPVLSKHATPLTPQFRRSGSTRLPRRTTCGSSELSQSRCVAYDRGPRMAERWMSLEDSGSHKCLVSVSILPGVRVCSRSLDPITPGMRMIGSHAAGVSHGRNMPYVERCDKHARRNSIMSSSRSERHKADDDKR